MNRPRPTRLSTSYIERLSRPGRHGDGHGGYGLALVVKPRADGGVRKQWVQRIAIEGERVLLGLGIYPIVTLKAARSAALENSQSVWNGIDPRSKKENKVPTFWDAALQVIAIRSPAWKSSATGTRHWLQSLRDYAGPINRKRVDRVTTTDVLDLLTPIWHDKRSTAQRLRRRISMVMQWAISQQLRFDNPAGDAIAGTLPKGGQRVKHHKALPHSQVASVLQTLRAAKSSPATLLGLEFLVLTAARGGEAVGARWEEINMAGKVWTIPAERMKTGVEHRVPLSSAALRILEQARPLSDGKGLVFPSARRGKQIATRTLLLLLSAHVDATVHGFRGSFKNWTAETGVQREVAEAALAHTVENQVEAAYLTTDLFVARAAVMQAWSDYLTC